MRPARILVPFMTGVAAFCQFTLFCSSADSPIAGGTSETTNGITAAIHTPGGAPAAHALVRLRPSDYLSIQPRTLAKSVALVADVTTDSEGRFIVSGIAAGSYTIEVTDLQTAAVLMTCEVETGDDTLDLGTYTIVPFATLSGMVAPDSVAGAVTVGIFGLERSAPVDPLTGAWSFSDLPQGAFALRASPSSPEHGAVVVDAPPVSSGSSLDLPPVTLVRFTAENYSQWTFSRTIRINTSYSGANIAEDVYGFPLLVRLNATNFSFPGARSDGRDIRFAKRDETPLRYEIEQWDASARRAAIWVLIDTIRGNDSTQSITIHWGLPSGPDLSCPDFSNGAVVFDTANGFAGVWHFGGHDYRADATFNRNNLLDNGSSRGDQLLGAGRYFDGSSFMSATSNATLEPTTLTVGCWFRRESSQIAFAKIVSKGQIPPPWNSYSLEMRESSSVAGFQVAKVDSSVHTIELTTPAVINEWIHLTAVFDGASGEGRLYYNGIPVGVFVNAVPLFYPSDRAYPLTIGAQHDGTASFRGAIDEIRVCGVARSPAWIRLCYENQRTASTLVSIIAE